MPQSSLIGIVLACTAVVGACSKNSTPAAPPDTSKQQWPACDASAATQPITFVHTNDLHGNYELVGNPPVSAYAAVKAFYKRTKAENPFTLLTSGGDDYEKGSIAEQLSNGLSTREILHAMQFDVRVIGNHDYGWSVEEVLENARDPFSAVLSSNIHYKGNDPKGFAAQDFVIKQVGCMKIGFFGLTSGPWDSRDSYVNGDFYPEFPTDLDYVAVAQKIVTAHRGEVDLMVLVSHIGEGSDNDVAKAVPGIDVVLGGHSHTALFTPDWVPHGDSGTVIIQAGSFATYVSRLDLSYDLKTKKLIDPQHAPYALNLIVPGDDAMPPDPELEATIEATMTKYAPNAGKPAVQVKSSQAQTSIGFIAARGAMKRFQADAALVDIGTIWQSWGPGPLTQQDFLNTFRVEREPPGSPGFNSFYTASIKGASLQNLKAAHPSGGTDGWVLVAPDNIDASAIYKLAIQKRPALNAHAEAATAQNPEPPAGYLPDNVTIGTPTFGAEAWEALQAEATARQAACRYIDSDEKVPSCD